MTNIIQAQFGKPKSEPASRPLPKTASLLLYCVDSIIECIMDRGETPHIVVNGLHPDAIVPKSLVNREGYIIFNLHPAAISKWHRDKTGLSFNAAFGGRSTRVFVPDAALIAVYSLESPTFGISK